MKKHPRIIFEDIARRWLRSLGIKTHKEFIARELQTHPDYPSLVSLTDFLDMGGMQYYAVESERAGIPDFNYPLLAYVNDGGSDYLMQVDGPAAFETDEKLRHNWSGIVLFAGEKARWEVPENTKLLQRQHAFAAIGIIAGLLVLAAVGAAFSFNPGLAPLTWGVLTLAGLTLGIFTITTELGLQIGIVNEVCNSIGGRAGCKAVLKSNLAKVYGGVTVADLALSYFLAQFIFFVAAAWYPALMATQMVIAMPLLLVAGVSVIVQKFRLKRWCALCLGIAGVLTGQSALAFAGFNDAFSVLQPVTTGYFLAVQAILCLAMQPVKAQLKDDKEKRDHAKDLLRWKRDPLLFITQWERMQQVDTATMPHELHFGNPGAALEIVVACNPFCGPCQYAHRVLDEIYETCKDQVFIKVRFLSMEDRAENIARAVTAIFQCARGLQPGEEVRRMLADWFRYMNMDKWSKRWQYNASLDVKDQLVAHRKWMNEAGVRGTPTFYVNGRKMPKNYILKDLMHLVPILAASEIALQPLPGTACMNDIGY
ncbi:hypothetical protein EGT74_00135 [Chitinophaga lutea]|uniref:Vitamin K epoxide reductase domain-containing protein n=1 Tax=Chitinophaga lutea TaxID=2488634 RepID=A0A3N4Q3F8_9BACT|nr:vitamin K epoxide reductase family protein [Chitinophaga lutea]RPE12001.1 hypothetical protein EGT74_00135 [Chitinophaga lutea]